MRSRRRNNNRLCKDQVETSLLIPGKGLRPVRIDSVGTVLELSAASTYRRVLCLGSFRDRNRLPERAKGPSRRQGKPVSGTERRVLRACSDRCGSVDYKGRELFDACPVGDKSLPRGA